VIKWKCLICETKQQTEVKPAIGQRLCGKCKINHYQRVVDIYRLEGGCKLSEAKLLLKQAKEEAKA
jgi:hypothetical protein